MDVSQPTGTVTFLFTDLEASTRQWEEHTEAMAAALVRHEELLRAVIERHDGYVFGHRGDGIAAAFSSAQDGVAAAVDGQRRMRAERWPEPVALACRMGLHTGVAEERGGEYFGPAVNRAARICETGHGGQVLVSAVTAGLLEDPRELDDLGQHLVAGLDDPLDLRQVVVDGDRGAYPPLRASDAQRHDLPAFRTPFLGRGEEIEQLVELLGSWRIVTLTGVGGVGKTRLAAEVASSVADDYDRVVFVDLSPVEEGDAVPAEVAGAAGLPVDEDPTGQVDKLVRTWWGRRVLLVLDNCEHLLDATGGLVDRITVECPGVDVLATSREALAVTGERAHRVPSLPLSVASRLFVERASAVRADLTIDGTDEAVVEEICRRLDGLPLALELAAARVAHMGLAEIASHLDERFRLLTGSRGRSQRQQTLRGAVDWSYDLLAPDERSLLRATAVFVGGFALDDLAAVWGRDRFEVLDLLGSLADKSLVAVREERDGTTRYRLLETIRMYAQERLAEEGEADALQRAHARHFLRRSLRHPPVVPDLNSWGVPADDDADLDNVVTALERFAERGELAPLGRLAGRLALTIAPAAFVDVAGAYLGRDDVHATLDDRAERALYATASASNANLVGHYREQLRWGEVAVETADDPATRGAAAGLLANACVIFDPERVPRIVSEGLEGLPDSASFTRLFLRSQPGLAHINSGRLEDGVAELGSLVRAGEAFPVTEIMLVRHVLGHEAPAAGLPAIGPGDLDFTIFGHRVPLVRALVAAARLPQDDAAGEAIEGLLQAARAVGSYPVRLLDRDVLLGCAALAFHQGDVAHAARLLAVIDGHVRSPGSFAVYLHYRDLVRERLPRDDRRAIIERAGGLAPAEVLNRELARLENQEVR